MVSRVRKIVEDDYRIDLLRLEEIIVYIYIFAGHICNHTVIFKTISYVFALIEVICILKIKKMYISSYIVFYALFIGYCIFQCESGISMNVANSYAKIETLVIDIFLNFLMMNYLFRDGNIEKFIKMYSQTGFIYCVFMLLTNINVLGSGRLGNDTFNFFGVTFYYQANGVGFIFAFAFIMYMYRILINKEKIGVLPAIICSIGAFLTGSRKALVIVIVGFFFMLFLFYEGANKAKLLVIGVISVAIMYYLVMNVPAFYNTVGNRFEALIEGRKTGKMTESSAQTRDELVDIAKQMYSTKKTYGWGLDTFRLVKGTYGLYSHNNYWEMLSCCGIVGTVIYYIGYVICAIYLLIGFIKKDRLSKFGLLCLIIFAVMEVGMITYYERPFLIIPIFGIIIGTKAIHKAKDDTNKLSDDFDDNKSIKNDSYKKEDNDNNKIYI